jgi:hypothetical protein
MHGALFNRLKHTPIPMADALTQSIDAIANAVNIRMNGEPDTESDPKKMVIDKLNNVKASIMGGKMQLDAKELKTEFIMSKSNGKIVKYELSYYAVPFHDNYSLIYIYNNNREKIATGDTCRDLVFVNIVYGCVQDVKYAKTTASFNNSKTKPFYQE